MSNNNVTVAIPGTDNWSIWWWYGFDNLQLDIVGFLAVLGEGAVLSNAQVSALSRLFYLPRLLPAPQALIRTSRPTTLPPTPAKVTGVSSGNVKDHIHHVAHVLLGEALPTFTVRCVEVKKKQIYYRQTRIDTFLRGTKPVQRAETMSPQMGPPLVKAKATGPLSWVTLLGFFLSLILCMLSIVFGDGFSFIATLVLSLLSTIIGISNKWTLELPKRPRSNAPAGDVVIRYPNGSYLVVKCDEDVARELYFAPEEINYNVKSLFLYRILSLLGTIMLMIGVIALANAKLELQIAWAGAYIIINIAHWTAAALPQRLHWDLSCYEVHEQSVVGGPKNSNFTEALWKAILLTKSTSWVKTGHAAPQTDVWQDWLIDAGLKAQEFGCSEGELIDPLWPHPDGSGRPIPGIVWEAPSNKEWDPKKVWNELNEEHNRAEEHSALPPTRAV